MCVCVCLNHDNVYEYLLIYLPRPLPPTSRSLLPPPLSHLPIFSPPSLHLPIFSPSSLHLPIFSPSSPHLPPTSPTYTHKPDAGSCSGSGTPRSPVAMVTCLGVFFRLPSGAVVSEVLGVVEAGPPASTAFPLSSSWW